jgi:hypothetical protein
MLIEMFLVIAVVVLCGSFGGMLLGDGFTEEDPMKIIIGAMLGVISITVAIMVRF